MTAERDRLAALIHEGYANANPDLMLAYEDEDRFCPWLADRLIAAGAHLDIDVERLARALLKAQSWHPHLVADAAARIAAAYREAGRG